LKGEKCYTDKCPVARRPYPPGQHGQGRVRFSPYGEQLQEKQKLKWQYRLLEKQFRNCFEKGELQKGITGENLLILLERRLDNVIYRLGFAGSRAEARLMVRHNHFLVNDRRVNIPSFLVRAGDRLVLREKSRGMARVQDSLGGAAGRGVPSWLELIKEEWTGKVKTLPAREDITMPVREHLIVELYSR
jgi:small subunit ribosomal protein S4